MSSKIEQQVMAGVGAIYIARTVTNNTALKIYALILSVWVFGRLVWVSKVFGNFFAVEKNGLGSISNYLLYAVEHTHLAVQMTLLVALVAFAGLCVDIVRSFSARTIYAA
ncbi:MAG: hypothetical protein KGH79_03605 [Patescibacteria group bacterium]|nr:hypothetical protein [Patescibacteria group bacterium]